MVCANKLAVNQKLSIPMQANPSSISAVYQVVEGFVLLSLSFLPRYPMHPHPEHHTGLRLAEGLNAGHGEKQIHIR